MNSTLTNQLQGCDLSLVQRELSDRREKILTAISERRIEPTPGLMIELAALNVALEDAPEVRTEVGHAS